MKINDCPLFVCLELANDNEELILEIIAKHEYGTIRMQVAKNNNITFKIAKILVNDENVFVRLCLSRNPKTPIEILRILEEDEVEPVRESAIKNILEKENN